MNRRDEVKALHGFEAWGDHIDDDAGFDGPTPLFLTDHERLFDLHFLAREALHPEGGSTRGYREYYAAEDRPDAGVMVIVRQLPSIKDAHEALVDILETSMALRLLPAEEREVSVGHVAFVGHDPLWTPYTLFAAPRLSRSRTPAERSSRSPRWPKKSIGSSRPI
ncbi:hypothetical protein [Brevundimonas denitrificans]|uniref:hypothetical protein n=1 Tax=Brevundimonas denitrificans TaxID=1443434 RepID=UPI00223BFD3F|nr:hypothetical protein [Brevundimonas denitrificans]